MNMQQFKNPAINFVILSFLLASCSSLTPVAPTNTTAPSVTPLPTNTVTPTSTPTPNRIRDFALSPDGSKIAVYEKDGIFIYDTISSEKTLFSGQACINCGCEGSGAVAFSPDGTKLAFSSSYVNNHVQVTDISTGKQTWETIDIPNDNCVTKIEFAPKENTIFVRSSHSTTGRCEYPEDTFELYSLDHKSTYFFESRIFQMRWCVFSTPTIKFLSNGMFYLFFYDEETSWLSIGNSTTGQITEQHEYDISKEGWYYDISQDGQALAISPSHGMFENPTTTLVNPTSRKTLAIVPYYVKLLKDQNQFLVHDLTYAWKFWKNGGVSCSYDFIVNENYLKFSADGNFLAVPVSESRVEIWKVSTCEKINTISVSE